MLLRFFLTLLICAALHIDAAITLKENLSYARIGSYLVIQQGQNYDFLYIRDKTPSHILLEEVSIPAALFQRTGLSWKAWFEQGAEGHTLWTLSQINVESGCFEKSYSFTHQSWADLSSEHSFFSILLNLPFEETPLQDRKRIGLPPGRGKPDYRAFWSPRFFFNGQQLSSIPFKAYIARWPLDHSDLADRLIEIYIPCGTLPCPTFFPYWVEVEGRLGNAKIRVVDSGTDAYSPHGGYSFLDISLTLNGTKL